MAEPLALGAQLVLAARLEPFGVGHERPQLARAAPAPRRVARQLGVDAPCRGRAPARPAGLPALRSPDPAKASSTASW